MPMIKVEMFAGRTVEQKRTLAEKLTDAFVEAAGGTRESVQVVLVDVEKSNWAAGGVLYSDKG